MLGEGNALVAHIGKRRIGDGVRYRVLASACFVLLTLLVMGCGAGVPPDQSREEPPPDNSENKPEDKQQGEKEVQGERAVQVNRAEKTAVGDLLVTLDEVLAEVQARRATFASAGNTRGAKLMADAADNVQAMQAAAEASDDGSGASASAKGTTATKEQRAAYNLLIENRQQFMENIEEARKCCGLPPYFLDDELREMNVEIKALRTELGIPKSQLKATTDASQDGYEATSATAQQYEPGGTTGGSPPSTTSATSTSAP